MQKIIADFIISKEFIIEDGLTLRQMDKIIEEYKNKVNEVLFELPGNDKVADVEWDVIEKVK